MSTPIYDQLLEETPLLPNPELMDVPVFWPEGDDLPDWVLDQDAAADPS